jgi:glycosyltransferase involved in cell wall biosynthesis
MEKPKFSIITVVYNGEKTISETIESVCNQTFQPFEYIIIDGNSSDSTVEIIQSFAIKYPFIKLVSEKDDGIYDAMNKGINLSSGNVIGILNSDDFFEIDCLEKVNSSFLKNGLGVHYGILRYLKNNDEIFVCRYSHNHLEKKMIPHPATFVPKSYYDIYGTFNSNYKYSADLDLIIRLKNAPVPYFPINNILANFRTDGVSNKVAAGIETLKIKRHYNLVNAQTYYIGRFKKFVRIVFGI